jgi:hypothetical protein
MRLSTVLITEKTNKSCNVDSLTSLSKNITKTKNADYLRPAVLAISDALDTLMPAFTTRYQFKGIVACSPLLSSLVFWLN